MFTVKQVRECDSHNGQKVHESWSIRFCQIERFEHFDMNCSRVGDSIVLRQVEVSNLFFQQSNLSTSIQMISNGEKPEGRIFLDCGSSRSSDIQDRFCSREEVQGGNDSCLIKAFLQVRTFLGNNISNPNLLAIIAYLWQEQSLRPPRY